MSQPPTDPDVAFHALSPAAALAKLHSRRTGLSGDEAAERLRRVGPNRLAEVRRVPAWRILLSQLRSVVVLLLVAVGLVSFVVGELLNSAAIAAVLLINTAIGFITEMRARRAMEALLRMEVPRAVALRDGRLTPVPGETLVPGDVIRVEAGEAVPADARIIDGADLRVDEAPLTGESALVLKQEAAVAEDAPLPDRTSMLYKGTTARAGAATAVVAATGARTQLGRIGVLVSGIRDEPTPLERRLAGLGRRLVAVALAVGLLVTLVGLLRGAPLILMLETGIALAIAAVPEGLPAVATVALAAAVRRMARRNALIRRLPSVETLGAVTLVCSDKTGTLTSGAMTVSALAFVDRDIRERDGALPHAASDAQLATALRVAVLANRASLGSEAGDGSAAGGHGDPTEVALLTAGRAAGVERARLSEDWPELEEVPFSSRHMLMATFNRGVTDDAVVAHVKGAPDRVLQRAGRVLTGEGERPMDDATRRTLLARSRDLGDAGLRVLALATGRPGRLEAAALQDLTFIALVGLRDPPAAGVRETIRLFRRAGIRTVMITGDQRTTARAIARELDILEAGGDVLDGGDLAALDDAALQARVGTVGAYSRVSPEQKLRVISACQQAGDVLAMLGDGVNDAAALKKADVGVAMGRRGTDAAKEVADVVLTDDRFSTIGVAVEEGRIVFDNIRKFVFYLFSCNLAEVLVLLAAGVAGLPLPITPLQILWLNLVTDTFPALALAFEPGEADVMRRPPREPHRAILSARFGRTIVVHSLFITLATLAAFVSGLSASPDGLARAVTMSFMTLALAQAFHLLNARSQSKAVLLGAAPANPYATGAILLVLALQCAAVYVPALAAVLRTYPLAPGDWLIIMPISLTPLVLGQALRAYATRRAAA